MCLFLYDILPAWGLITYVSACGCHTAAPWEPSGLIYRALQKLQIIIIIIIIIIDSFLNLW